MMHNYALLQPNLRSICESLHVSGSSSPCHWINTAKKLGVQLSEAQMKQQCSHPFPIDSCTPLVSCITADHHVVTTTIFSIIGEGGIQLLLWAKWRLLTRPYHTNECIQTHEFNLLPLDSRGMVYTLPKFVIHLKLFFFLSGNDITYHETLPGWL